MFYYLKQLLCRGILYGTCYIFTHIIFNCKKNSGISPVFAPTCKHHHYSFPVCTGHFGDVAVDKLVVLVHNQMFKVPRGQDLTPVAGCIVHLTNIP